jgi:hypothetical protein
MKLTEKAIAAISNRSVVLQLALGLNFTELWINKLIEANKDNGPLTTIKAIGIIKQETGFTQDEILESESETVSAGVLQK